MSTTDLTVHAPSLSEQMQFAQAVVTQPERGGTSILPESYRGNPANVLIAVGLGASMGLSPAESLYRIAVIKGKPSASAELIAANVRKAGHKLRVRVQESPPMATATIIRADDPDEPTTVVRDMEWAQRMGLANEPNYKKQPATMLSYRAITACARLACPEALYGVAYTPEELDEGPAQGRPARTSTGPVTVAEILDAEPEPEPAADREAEHPEPITAAQLKKMGALMREASLTDRASALAFVIETIGRDVESRNDLTKAEAGQVIDALEPLVQPASAPSDVDQQWGLAEEGEP